MSNAQTPEDANITIQELRKLALATFPTDLANNHKISAPITEPIRNKIIAMKPSVPANKLPIIKNLDVSLLIRLFGIRHVY